MTTLQNYKGDCWLCGTDENITRAHAIPQRLKPRKNITMPLCRQCHDVLDSRVMFGYEQSEHLQQADDDAGANDGI